MVPLAITSTNKMVKRLGGKRWNRLHKLVYLAGVGGVLHYWMLVKSDTRLPLTFAFILALLLGYRLLVKYSPPGTAGILPALLTKDRPTANSPNRIEFRPFAISPLVSPAPTA